MSIEIIIALVGIALSVGGVGVAAVQTVRLSNVTKIRDTHLRQIWFNLKNLSGDLLLKDEREVPRAACGHTSQSVEVAIATLIVNLSNINRKTVDKWKANNEIDDFDYRVLNRLTLK